MCADLLREIGRKIRSRSATVSVIGLGHVGLPSAVAFAAAGYPTVGVEKNAKRLGLLKRGKSYLADRAVQLALPQLVRAKRFEVTKSLRRAVREGDCIIISVPTPIDQRNRPDTSEIRKVLRSVARHLSIGKLVVIESSVYPGFTDGTARDLLEASGLRCGIDFALAYSPSRIAPGRARETDLTKIPKVVGGVDAVSGEVATNLYQRLIKAGVVNVRDARSAECVKMLENVYRFVNIALVNELALLHQKIGVDIFEVISAAASKPFGFQAHYPGPGVGGPCIPKDHFYLQHVARRVGMRLDLVEASTGVNHMMPLWVAREVRRELKGLRLKSPLVSVFGLAYKADIGETTASPSITVIRELISAGIRVSLYDPFVPSIRINRRVLECEATPESASTRSNCLVFMVDHQAFSRLKLSNLRKVAAQGCILFDTKNLFEAQEVEEAGFRYLGLGKSHRPETS